MSVHRAVLFVLAALSTVGMTSAASAGCGGCGTPAIVYERQVIAVPPPRPVLVRTWTRGCGCACSCRGLFGYAAAIEPTPIAPAPIYVVNQGPDYTGPGIMVPYRTWTPAVRAYPYGYGYGRFHYRHYHYGFGAHRIFRTRRRVAFHARFHQRALIRRPMPVPRPMTHHHP